MIRPLLIATAVLAASSAIAAPFHPFCTDPGACIERPGYVMDGFPVGYDDAIPPAVLVGGNVNLHGAKATRVTIIEAGDGVVIFSRRGVAYVTTTEAAWVQCPDRPRWLGTAPLPFAC